MKFLCLAYLDRGLAPPPGVAAEYGALAEAMARPGSSLTAASSAPRTPPSSSG
jgi:hypothetical protein